MDNKHDVGALFYQEIGTVPAASAAGAVTGSAIDRQGHYSCKLMAATGASTGTPTSFTLDAKIQHCDTSGGTYADYTDPATGVAAAITAITAVNSKAEVDVNLAGAKRYLKVVTTAAFVGGSTPTIANSVALALGGSDTLPSA